MIIDFSYFHSQIAIPSLNKPEVQMELGRYIVVYEQEYLQRILGDALAQEFVDGISQNVIEQKWVDLLVGTQYTYYGAPGFWSGLAKTISDVTVSTSDKNFAWIVGSTGSPVSNGTTFQDKRLLNKLFEIELRGYGTLTRKGDTGIPDEAADYEFVNGNTINLLNGKKFEANTVYIIHVKGSNGEIDFTEVKISPIAFYIYFKWLSDHIVQVTPFGVRQTKAENAMPVDPEDRLRQVWNRMVEINQQLVKYVTAMPDLYGYYTIPYETGYVGNFPYNYLQQYSAGVYGSRFANELLEKMYIHGI